MPHDGGSYEITQTHYTKIIRTLTRYCDQTENTMLTGTVYFYDETMETLKEMDLEDFYDDHHKKFTMMVKEELEEQGTALIVDCHSFSNEVLPHEESDVRPDICIGTDDYHTPNTLSELVRTTFESAGLNVAVNEPFAGTMVPLDFLDKNKNVRSIMIEVNHKLYLDDNFQKNANFNKIKELIHDVLKAMIKQNSQC